MTNFDSGPPKCERYRGFVLAVCGTDERGWSGCWADTLNRNGRTCPYKTRTRALAVAKFLIDGICKREVEEIDSGGVPSPF